MYSELLQKLQGAPEPDSEQDTQQKLRREGVNTSHRNKVSWAGAYKDYSVKTQKSQTPFQGSTDPYLDSHQQV